MRFQYEYRTSDNVRHVGEVCAADREAAFAALKAQGIRPGLVKEAPGFFNKLFGKGKRWLAIAALAVLCVALAVAVGRARRNAPQAAALASTVDSTVRRQIIGDAAVIEKGIRTGWADVFAEEGDRFLASFAVPGVPVAVRNTTEAEIRKVLNQQPTTNNQLPADSLEARQIRAIVAGMKDELRRFLAKQGTIAEYCDLLVKRQEEELSYFNRAKTEVEEAKRRGMGGQALEDFLDERNDMLRQMGIRSVSMP